MKSNIALIVSDEAPRRNTLCARAREAGLHPVNYPNAGAYCLELRDRQPKLFIVDVSIPIRMKLALVDKAVERYKDLKVILVGKKQYLEESGPYANTPNVILCDEIDDILTELSPGEAQS